MRFPLVFLPFLLAACGSEDASSPSSEADAADTSVTNGGCDYECFPGATCTYGLVTISTGSGPTCGTCDTATYKCKKRCRTDDAGLSGAVPGVLLCDESRPKHVGDPCDDELDCVPAAGDDAGGIGALSCHGGTCTAVDDAGVDGG